MYCICITPSKELLFKIQRNMKYPKGEPQTYLELHTHCSELVDLRKTSEQLKI